MNDRERWAASMKKAIAIKDREEIKRLIEVAMDNGWADPRELLRRMQEMGIGIKKD